MIFPLIYAQEESGTTEKSENFFVKIMNFFKNLFNNNSDDESPSQENITGEIETNEEILDASPESEGATCSREFSPTLSTGPYYTGPLFDAHFHMPNLIDASTLEGHGGDYGSDSNTDPVLDKDVMLDDILCVFDKEKVKGAIGFSIGAEEALEETLQMARSVKQRSSGTLNLFLMPVTFTKTGLENIESSDKGLFKGYGEIAFYFGDLKNQNPDDKKFLDMYEVAGKNNLVVMIHPDRNQKSDIESALQKNPNVNFLLHGFEIENDIVDLMDKYPNVYFSIDSAVFYAMQGLFILGPKEQFVSRFEQEFDVNMNGAVNKWKSTIEKHPDRFMWGSDRGMAWHYDEEISVLFEEFARAFIGKLDPAVQEKYAYRNAEKLLE